jgi:hypothetical protein
VVLVWWLEGVSGEVRADGCRLLDKTLETGLVFPSTVTADGRITSIILSYYVYAATAC